MEESILKSTKKVLGIQPDDESFDLDVITHINSAFSDLYQIGLGPEDGFWIEDASYVWEDFTNESPAIISQVKVCVYLRVRMLFDPPTTSYLIGAMEKQIQEHLTRLSVMREEAAWVDPDPPRVEVAE